jgi:hypothetical protein
MKAVTTCMAVDLIFLNQVDVREREVALVTDHDVNVDLDAEDVPGLAYPLSNEAS